MCTDGMDMPSDEAIGVGASATSDGSDGVWSRSQPCSDSECSEGTSYDERSDSEVEDDGGLQAEIEKLEAELASKEAKLLQAKAREDVLRTRIATVEQHRRDCGDEVAKLEAAASSASVVQPNIDPEPLPRPATAQGSRALDDLVNAWAQARQAMGLGFGE